MLQFNETLEFTFEGKNYVYKQAWFEDYPVLLVEEMELLGFTGYLVTFPTQPFIMINSLLLECPEELQRFVLYHEIGHLVNNHIFLSEDAKKRTGQENMEAVGQELLNRATNSVIDKRELEADAYAISIIGWESTVKCLRWIREIIELGLEEKLSDPNLTEQQKDVFRILNNAGMREIDIRIMHAIPEEE